MSSRLSDTDRTLLSAYMDGELYGEELRQAESLIGASADARTYLGHLRSLRGFSTQAFPAVAVGVAAGAAGKLSGSAITAAAKKSALIKGFSFGGWGAAGLVAAASVAAGVTFAVNDAPTPDHPARPVRAVATVARPAAAVSVDTNSLLVPPMTPSEMVHFAVDGTIPIDAMRSQYLTLAAHGRDSMTVELRDKPPATLAASLDDVGPSQWQELDSVHRAIRTSLLQYKGKSIAISCDIPSLRLKALEHLERIRPKLPVRLWTEIETVRRQVAATYAVPDRTSHAEWSKGVPYVVVSLDGFGQHRGFERIRIPDPASALEGAFNVMMVDGAALGELQAMTLPQPPIPPTFEAGSFTFHEEETRPQRTVRAFNPTGELPTPREREMQMEQEAEEGDNPLFMQRNAAEGLMIHGDGRHMTITINGDTLIRNIESTLRMVDSTLMRINGNLPRLIDEQQREMERHLERSREELRKGKIRIEQRNEETETRKELRNYIDQSQQQESGGSIQVEVGHEP